MPPTDAILPPEPPRLNGLRAPMGIRGSLVIGAAALLIACAQAPDRPEPSPTGAADGARPADPAPAGTGVDPPDWYAEPYYPARGERILKGYGQGATAAAARMDALGDIGRQLGVTVRSVTEDVSMEWVEAQERVIQEAYHQKTRSEATHHLKDWDVLRSERHAGHHFAQVRLDRRPAAVVAAGRLSRRLPAGTGGVEWAGPDALTRGALVRDMERALRWDGTADRRIRVHLSLVRLDERWHLRVVPEGGDGFHVPLDEPDFHSVFAWSRLDGDALGLSLLPLGEARGYNRLRHGDPFVFEARVPDVDAGYLTVFNVYEDGRVSVLEENAPAAEMVDIPETAIQERGGAFVAQTLVGGAPTQDLYVAVLSMEVLATSEFQRMLENLPPVSGESAYRVHELVQWLARHQDAIQGVDVLSVHVQP